MSDLKTVWITEGIKPDTIKWAEEFAKKLIIKKHDKLDKDLSLSTSQLRKFFGEIKRIQGMGYENLDSKEDILMLKPKLAYAKGRAKKENKITEFYSEMSKGLDAIDYSDDTKGKKHFQNFTKIFEAVVAYHKAYIKEAGGE